MVCHFPGIIVSWTAILLIFGILPYFSLFGIINSNGFCTRDADSILFIASIPFGVLLTVICLSIVSVCCILTGIYIKRNVLEDNVEIKKAVAKILLYLTIVSVISFVSGLLPAATPAIREATRASSGTVGELVINYTLRVIYTITSIATPFITIILLKPLRTAVLTYWEKDNTMQKTN